MATYEVFLRDRGRKLRAQVDAFQSLKLSLRYCDVSAWEMIYAVREGGEELETWLDLGCGIVVRREGAVLLSGPILRREIEWSEKGKVYTISGKCDLWWLSKRIALPVPGGPPYTSASHDVRTGTASTVILQYASYNGEAGGHSWRRIPGMVLGTDLGIGNTITGKARFAELLSFVQALAMKGNVAFRMRQAAGSTNLVLEVYQPTDRSATVIFSPEMFNLTSYHLVEEMPEGNYGYIGGQGTGTARAIYEGGDSSSITRYGRLEFFKDQRNEDDTDELPTWLDLELEKQAARRTFTCRFVDTEYPRFGVDYEIGDTVTVQAEGLTFAGTVQEARIEVSEDGETVDVVIGTAADRLKILQKMDDFDERLSGLEVV